MKWRKIIVDQVEYSWRVHGSAGNIELRGPYGHREFAEAGQLLGVDWGDLYTKHWAFDRHHDPDWYVDLPVLPNLVATYIKGREAELAATPKRTKPTKRPGRHLRAPRR